MRYVFIFFFCMKKSVAKCYIEWLFHICPTTITYKYYANLIANSNCDSNIKCRYAGFSALEYFAACDIHRRHTLIVTVYLFGDAEGFPGCTAKTCNL